MLDQLKIFGEKILFAEEVKHMSAQHFQQVEKFKYLGKVKARNGRSDEEMKILEKMSIV